MYVCHIHKKCTMNTFQDFFIEIFQKFQVINSVEYLYAFVMFHAYNNF